MSIPLYYAANWKQFVYKPKIFQAQTGFGFQENGTLRIPQQQTPSALRVIDDSVLPFVTIAPEQVESFASLCETGCFADFERSALPVHAAFLTALDGYMAGKLFLLPPRFLRYAPSAMPLLTCCGAHNCWERFVAQCHRSYPNGWALEVTPWRENTETPLPTDLPPRFLEQALCRCHANRGSVVYEDTGAGLQKKLALAEAYGCRLCIGLLEELEAILPSE